jgi:hypothetical protein
LIIFLYVNVDLWQHGCWEKLSFTLIWGMRVKKRCNCNLTTCCFIKMND